MAISQRLDLRQTQALVMTPQLQQAIKLLQLSNMELQEFVLGEIEQNPLLDRPDGDGAEGRDGDDGRAGDAEGPMAEPQVDLPPLRDAVDFAASDRLAPAADAPLDADYGNVWTNTDAGESGVEGSDGLTNWQTRGGGAGFDDEMSLEQTLTRGPSLRDHLLEQVSVDIKDPGDRLIALALVEMLDDAGYLVGDVEGLAVQFGCPIARVEGVLARLQRFDPPGIFARSLRECLAIQLREKDRLDPAMQALLDNLDLLARRDMPGLIRVCGVDVEDIQGMIAEIRALDPKPALAFEPVVAETVTPDILMRVQPGGGWSIELNAETLPRVLVNQRYHTRLASSARSKKDKEYVAERLQSANWLVKSLHQRATTIMKVATEIVRQQDAFFRHGIEFLRPLILRDIADAIGMHESTVSRVTANKYMSTPRGLFELKYFFTSSIAGSDGQSSFSAEAVRFKIKALIDAETTEEVLSDDRIVEILREGGIDIARRTVAKYREGMKIPSSVQRRREKASQF